MLRGRSYALLEDVTDLAADVLRHRLVLSYEAMADGMSPDRILSQLMRDIPAPAEPLKSHATVGSEA